MSSNDDPGERSGGPAGGVATPAASPEAASPAAASPAAASPAAPEPGPGIADPAQLSGVSAEFALFHDFVSGLAGDDMVAGIEAAVGPDNAARARAAVRTLTEVDASVRRAAGDAAGAELATLPATGAAPARVEAAVPRAASPRLVSAEFALFDQFVDRVATPDALATLATAVGPELAARAHAAASTLIDVSAELRLMAPSEQLARPSRSAASAELAPFDQFVAGLHPETVDAIEESLGLEAALRARAAARALMDVSAELRLSSVELPEVARAPSLGAPRAPTPAFAELHAVHDRAWASAEDSLTAIADMHIAAWTAAKRSIAAAAELSRGVLAVSAEQALVR
jgi:hypothetical protein